MVNLTFFVSESANGEFDFFFQLVRYSVQEKGIPQVFLQGKRNTSGIPYRKREYLRYSYKEKEYLRYSFFLGGLPEVFLFPVRNT